MQPWRVRIPPPGRYGVFIYPVFKIIRAEINWQRGVEQQVKFQVIRFTFFESLQLLSVTLPSAA